MNYIVQQRELPARPGFLKATAVRKQHDHRDQQRDTRRDQKLVGRPDLGVLGPRIATVADHGLGRLEFDGDVGHDAEDDGGEEDGDGAGGDL